MATLGNLRSLDPRQIWKNEAGDFTPWMAKDENIALLGEALGLELEVENTEVAAGLFSADILARDTATSAYVIIENQLERTNHDHLGKAITYAAVLDARTLVWVAPKFTDEHKKALDWLNDNSSDELSFFGVQAELWQIDQSAPAIRFNVLSRPAQTGRAIALQRSKGELSDTKRLQLEWWTEFRDALAATNAFPSVRSPRAQHWYNLALGRTGIHLSLTFNTFDNKLGVRVYMRNRHGGEQALAQLRESREEIEEAIGQELVWDINPDAMDKIVGLYRDANVTDRTAWPQYLKWMVDTTIRFRQVFAPRVRELDLDWEGDDESGAE